MGVVVPRQLTHSEHRGRNLCENGSSNDKSAHPFGRAQGRAERMRPDRAASLPLGPAPSTPTAPPRKVTALPCAPGAGARVQSDLTSRRLFVLQGLGGCSSIRVDQREGPSRTGTASWRAFDHVRAWCTLVHHGRWAPEWRRAHSRWCGQVSAWSAGDPGLTALAPWHAPRTLLRRAR